jgi:enoyl-[acyl-carrier protein] reductase I
LTYHTQRSLAFVRPLAEQVGASLVLPLDVHDDAQLEDVFRAITEKWGHLDFVLHAVAHGTKADVAGRVVDSSREAFLAVMDSPCHSFIRMAHRAEPLMRNGGCLLTTTYYGSEKVMPHYNVMGPVKAALESTVRYLAAELGQQGIRVNALSPGPISTRAAAGVAHFDDLVQLTLDRTPAHATTCIDCVGAYATFLSSDAAHLVTGSIVYVDAGFNIMGS